MLKNYTLLITGCIAPDKNVPFLEIKNAQDRRTQYIESIIFYITNTSIKRIVFCDNSSALPLNDLYEIAKSKSKNFEWISFQGNTKECVDRGKGYGEGEIIEYALKSSQLIKQSEYIVKVTGRVIIKNINFLIRNMNIKKLYFQRNTKINIDTKFYGMPLQIYKKYFLHLYKLVNDKNNRYLENLFSDTVIENNLKIDNFVVFPNAQGLSGSTGQSYAFSFRKRLILTIKNYLQRNN